MADSINIKGENISPANKFQSPQNLNSTMVPELQPNPENERLVKKENAKGDPTEPFPKSSTESLQSNENLSNDAPTVKPDYPQPSSVAEFNSNLSKHVSIENDLALETNDSNLIAQSSSNQNFDTEPQEQAQSKKRDRTMAEFVLMMDQYTPIIPDLVTDYFLTQAGFDCEDYRVKRVLALATQKFVSDIATDAYQYAKIRNQAPKDRKSSKNKKTTLTMEDLSPALSEYGINVKKPDYFI